MQHAMFPALKSAEEEPVDVWRCATASLCEAARKLCPDCNHKAMHHDNYVDIFFGGKSAYICTFNMGMGDPCGCEKRFKK